MRQNETGRIIISIYFNRLKNTLVQLFFLKLLYVEKNRFQAILHQKIQLPYRSKLHVNKSKIKIIVDNSVTCVCLCV